MILHHLFLNFQPLQGFAFFAMKYIAYKWKGDLHVVLYTMDILSVGANDHEISAALFLVQFF